MQTSLLGYGVYVPRMRIKTDEIAAAWGGSKGTEKAVTNMDEDAVTMAVESARSALAHSGLTGSEIEAIYLGTSSSPYTEQTITTILAEVLGTPPGVFLADFTGSTRSAVAALLACSDGIESGRFERALVIGTDDRPAAPGSAMEASFGAGAAALVLGRGEGLALMGEAVSFSKHFVDRWRASDDEYVRDFDPRFTRQYGYLGRCTEAVRALCGKTGMAVDGFDHVVLQHPDPRGLRELAAAIRVPKEKLAASQGIFPAFGDLGSAALFMGLASALTAAKEGQSVLAVSYGAGVSDAFSMTVGRRNGREPTPSVAKLQQEKRNISYLDYLKLKRILTTGEPPFPMAVPPPSPTFMRGTGELLRLEAARCTGCGFLNYPPSMRTICVRCGSTALEKAVLSRRGRIHTFCVNYYMPPGFEIPLANILVDLDSGGKYMGMGTELTPDELRVGMEVELVLRRITKERGVSVYGYKVRPIR